MQTTRKLSGVSRFLIPSLSFAFLLSPLRAHQPHDPILAVAMSPNYQQDRTLLLATDYLTVSIGVYLPLLSSDGGNTLTPVRGIPNQPINSIQFSPSFASDGTALMGGDAGLFKSTDRGLNWTPVSVGAAASINSIAFSPTFLSDGIVFAISNAGVFRSTDRAVSFSAITAPGPLTDSLSTIAISPNFAADHELLIGGKSDGIFRSVSGGASWTKQTQGLPLPEITSLVFSPAFASDKTAYAGTYGAGVYVSRNSGTTFAGSSSGITDQNVTCLITYPGYAQTGTLMISTATAGIFVSNDRSQTWTKGANVSRPLATQSDQHYRVIAAAKTSNTTATTFLGMFEGFWTSTNKAQSWTYVDMLPTYLVRELEISSTFPQDQTVLATTYGGGQLYSGDGGTAWSIRNTGARNAYPDADAISPNFQADRTFGVGDLKGLQLSTDAGLSWQTVPGLNAPSYVRAIAFSPNIAQDSVVLIGTDNRGSGNPSTVFYQGKSYPNQGLFFSSDGGVHWMPTSIGGPEITNIAISPAFAFDKTALAASATYGIYRSTDGGHIWTPVFNLANDPGILQLAMSPAFPVDHTAFAATPHSGIYKTVDGGVTWNPLPNSAVYTALNFAISPNFQADQTIFVGTFQSGLIVSRNGGLTYQATGLSQNFVTGLAISSGFLSDHTLFAATYRGIFKTTDGGATWLFADAPNRQENDRSVNISYSGTWSSNASTSASTSTYQNTTETGASVSVAFFGTGFSWIGLKGPHGGTVNVSVDGVGVASESFFAAQPAYQQTVFQQSGLACAPHVVVVTATSSQPQGINFDAVDATRGACGY